MNQPTNLATPVDRLGAIRPALSHDERNRQATSGAPRAHNQIDPNLWVDNITCDLIDRRTLKHFDEPSVTGLTTNPTIFDRALSRSSRYDTEVHRQLDHGATAEKIKTRTR